MGRLHPLHSRRNRRALTRICGLQPHLGSCCRLYAREHGPANAAEGMADCENRAAFPAPASRVTLAWLRPRACSVACARHGDPELLKCNGAPINVMGQKNPGVRSLRAALALTPLSLAFFISPAHATL